MKKVTCVINFFFLIFLSCNSGNSDKANSKQVKNSDPILLSGERILEDEYQAIGLHLVDTILMVKLTKSKTYAYRLYNVNDFSLISEFAKLGEGPKDWGSPRFGDQVLVNENGDKQLLINDGHRLRVRLFNLTEFIKNNTTIYDDDFRLHAKHGITQSIFKIKENQYAGVPGIDAINRGRLIIYDREMEETTVSELFPKVIDQSLISQEQYSLYFSHLAKHPSKPIFASAMVHFDRIDILDSSGNLIAKNIDANFDEEAITNNPKISTENGLSDLIMYYQDLKVTEDRIYALYYNQKGTSYGKNFIPTRIRIFDWDGNLLSTLEVPDYLMSFAVDEAKSAIYGVDYFNEKIFKYDISKVSH